MTKSAKRRPVLLCVLDGWGERAETDNNAIALAQTPVWDRLSATCPTGHLDASEGHVGLPSGQMGNSEVGHMNLGAGRVVKQDLPRIDDAIARDSIKGLPVYTDFTAALRKSGGTAHIVGLLSPGGVHSHQAHMAALVRMLTESGIPCVVHALLDGRDTPPSSAKEYMRTFLKDAPGATVGTVIGRFYAMDRDKRWDRIEKAYNAIVSAKGEAAPDAVAAIEESYANDVTDEFVLPTVVGGYAGIQDGDGLLMANFRADRAREILTALVDPAFDGFARQRRAEFADAIGMVEYSDALNPFLRALFPAQKLDNVLGQVLADAGMKQLRIAETEKYAHVTFFFNGGEETTFPGEERILVPSPKVATYDLQPEMSAAEVTDRLVDAIGGGTFDFILVNFANTDMVGHTGDLKAAIKAVETVDACLGRLETAIDKAGGVMLITADHGNAEQMMDATSGQPHTAHTTNLVPLILAGNRQGVSALSNGKLADIAPTALDLLGLTQPSEMSGKSLIIHAEEQREAG